MLLLMWICSHLLTCLGSLGVLMGVESMKVSLFVPSFEKWRFISTVGEGTLLASLELRVFFVRNALFWNQTNGKETLAVHSLF